MVSFIIRRSIYGVLVLFGVVIVVFFLFNILPGDPARLTLGQRADVSSLEAVRKDLGLDKPMHIQFLMYLNDLSPVSIHEAGDDNQIKYDYVSFLDIGASTLVLKAPYLRRSYQTKKPVSEILMEALPGTFILALSAILMATIIGIFVGVIAAINQGGVFDNIIVSVSVFGISLPSYFSGIILAWLFGFLLAEYTGLNITGQLYELDDRGERTLALHNLILPMITLGIRPLAIIVQLTRGAMLEVLSHDYIRTARAKGLAPSKVLYKHALQNALNPVVTAISGWFASLLAGAFFVEWIFNWNGIGYVTVQALEQSDFPVVMGSVLVTATIFVLINLSIDIIYGVLDPRVSVKST